MPDWIAVIILGIIEGLTEFIPVSSTGHLLLAERWLPKQSDLFNIVIQCGAVIAVLPLFPERLRQFFFKWKEPATQLYLAKIFTAFLITSVLGFGVDQAGFELPETAWPVAAALLIGGILFVLVERWLYGRKKGDDITWAVVVAVGIGQIIAGIFPGTSRSGATILLALILGVNRPLATEFSFLVGIPTMLAAGGWKILKHVRHPGETTENWTLLAIATLAAAVVSFAAVRWLLRYVQTHTFTPFGWYRIALALLVLLVLLG